MNKVLDKMTSARFLLALMFGSTACYALIMDKIDAQAFLGLAAGVITGYQMKKRPDDTKEQ